jgi:hypothetical protein
MKAREAYEYLKTQEADITIEQAHPFDDNTRVVIRIDEKCFYAYGAVDLVYIAKRVQKERGE